MIPNVKLPGYEEAVLSNGIHLEDYGCYFRCRNITCRFVFIMEILYIIVLYVKYVCFLFRVLLETIISKMEDLVYIFS